MRRKRNTLYYLREKYNKSLVQKCIISWRNNDNFTQSFTLESITSGAPYPYYRVELRSPRTYGISRFRIWPFLPERSFQHISTRLCWVIETGLKLYGIKIAGSDLVDYIVYYKEIESKNLKWGSLLGSNIC